MRELVLATFMLETNPCVLGFTISTALKEAVTAAEFGTFTVRYGLKKSMNGLY